MACFPSGVSESEGPASGFDVDEAANGITDYGAFEAIGGGVYREICKESGR